MRDRVSRLEKVFRLKPVHKRPDSSERVFVLNIKTGQKGIDNYSKPNKSFISNLGTDKMTHYLVEDKGYVITLEELRSLTQMAFDHSCKYVKGSEQYIKALNKFFKSKGLVPNEDNL